MEKVPNAVNRNADPICALMVIDLRTGGTVHWLKMEGILHELYDVVALPGLPGRPPASCAEVKRVGRSRCQPMT